MCLKVCFCKDFKKILREACNFFSRLEEIFLLCYTHPFNYAGGVVYGRVVL